MTPGSASGTPAPFAQPQRRAEASHADARDSLNELLERSRAIARQAAATLVTAFKEVMADPAVAGGFAVESARDLVQYLLRRGELTPADAERLLKVAESSAQRGPAKRVAPAKPVAAKPVAAKPVAAKPVAAKPAPVKALPVKTSPKPVVVKPTPAKAAAKPAPVKSSAKPAAAAKKPASATKSASAAKKGTAKKSGEKKTAGKPSVKKARR